MFEHVLGKNLCAPDALSRRPDHVPASDMDNKAVTLLPDDLFVNLIDTSLSDKLCHSSASDPLVLDTLHALPGAVPTTFRSHLSDWRYNASILTYQGHVYVPTDAALCHSVIARHHDYPTAGHPGILKTANWLPWNSGGQALPLMFAVMSTDVPCASRTKPIPIRPDPHSSHSVLLLLPLPADLL